MPLPIDRAPAGRVVAPRCRRAPLLLLLASVALLSACAGGPRKAYVEDNVARLTRDVAKVRFAIRTTKILLARARGATYLPDLYNRLAGLYIEQARYHYQIAYEKQKDRSAGVVSVQTRLLKNQAIATYRRLLALFPDYPDADKVTFFMGHEMRELGDYENMLKTYQELADKYPKSEYRLEALLVMGDYHFDKAELTEAEKFYGQVLDSPETRVHAMARYKLAWVKINRAEFKQALKLFEGSISAARRFLADKGGKSGAGSKIDLRREALVDSVFCYTEVHKPKNALPYFRDRADSKTTYLAALHKLGNRYYVKQNWKATAQIYREILSMTGDVEDAVEYAHRLFESVTNGKIYSHGADDVSALIRVVRRRYYNHTLDDKQRKKLLETFEKYTRDIATRLQDLANEKKDKEMYLAAANAYRAYLTFFEDDKHSNLVRSNLAEALYAANQYLDAGKFYEQASRTKGKDSKDTLYNAVVSFFEALKGNQKLTRLEVVQGRAGLRRAGQRFLRKYPRETKVQQVKFNIARTYYDAGEFDEAIRMFTDFVDQFTTTKEAPVAAHLVLDAYRSSEDYDGLITAGKEFTARGNLGGPEFKNEVAQIIKGAEDALLRTETIKASDEGEGGDKLDQIARKYRGTSLGAKALLNKFVTARNSKDPEKIFEIGEEFLRSYPASEELANVLSTMGQIAVGSLQFERGATYLEAASRRKKGEEAVDLLKAAAVFRIQLGQRNKAERDLGKLLRTGVPPAEKAGMAVKVARLHIEANDWGSVIGVLQRASSAGASSPQLLWMLGYALFRQGNLADAQQYLSQAVQSGRGGGGEGKEAAAAAQFYLSEITFKTFEGVQLSSDLSQLGPSLQQKLTYMAQTREGYKAVVGLGSATWSVAAMGRLASVDQQAADAMRNLQLPSGLPDEVVKQVRGALEGNAAPLATEAKAATKQCATIAKKFMVLSDAANACLDGQAPTTDPLSAMKVPSVSRERPSGVSGLQRTLAVRPKDMPTILKLGKLYLRAGNPYMARMIFGKGLEVRETAELLNLVGAATARLGQHEAAYSLFDKALKKDSGLVPARLNKAWLLAHYGHKAAAKAERRKASDRGGLSADDPELIPGAFGSRRGG